MIPTHLTDGRLPEGIHAATWAEVVHRFSFTARRRALLARILPALVHLRDAGCSRVWLTGSFVRTKPNPMDVDVVWDVTGVDPDALHEMFMGPSGLPLIKAVFGADLFPSHIVEGASNLPFVEFFQMTRDGRPCGIVLLDLYTLDLDTL